MNSQRIVDDVVRLGAENTGWTRKKYIDEKGQRRIRMTKEK